MRDQAERIATKAIEVIGRMPVTSGASLIAVIVFFFPVLGEMLEMRFADEGLNGIATLGCHLLHWSGEHLFWDLGMFIGLGAIAESKFPKRYYTCLLLTALVVPASVQIFHPELSSYRGLSGIDTAIFSLLATHFTLEGIKQRDLLKCSAAAAWLLMFGKSAFELLSGGVLFVNAANFAPVPVAHIVGMVVGGAVALLAANIAVSRQTALT